MVRFQKYDKISGFKELPGKKLSIKIEKVLNLNLGWGANHSIYIFS